MTRRECLKAVTAIMLAFPTIADKYAHAEVWAANSLQLRLVLTLANPKPYELVDQTLWLYLPVAVTATQKLESIDVTIPYKQEIDPLRQTILSLSLPAFAPKSTKIVTVSALVSVSHPPKAETLSNPSFWLEEERYIEKSDPHILALAGQLTKSQPNETALAIYRWVSQKIASQGYVADDLGAAYALAKRQGDCTESAYLVTALARANGIPARVVGGYVVNGSTVLKATDYHNWAELYFEDAWQLVDAQKQYYLASNDNYIAFHYYKGQATNRIGLAHRYSVAGDFSVSF